MYHGSSGLESSISTVYDLWNLWDLLMTSVLETTNGYVNQGRPDLSPVYRRKTDSREVAQNSH